MQHLATSSITSTRAHHGPPDKSHVGAHAYTTHRSHLDEEVFDLEEEGDDELHGLTLGRSVTRVKRAFSAVPRGGWR
jgi:hypothetical protein